MTIEKLNKIADIRVLLFGDFMVDKYIHGKVSRISPEAPVPVLEVTARQTKLGGAGNVVNNIMTLGASVRVLGCVGDDADGDWILSELSEKGIETGYMRKYPQMQTISKTRLVSKNQQFLRYDEEKIQDIPDDYVKEIRQQEERLFQDIQAVIISDYGKGAVTKEGAQFLTEGARRRGIPVIIDPKGTDYSKYKGADVCTPNVKELGDVTGRALHTEQEILEAGQKLREDIELKYLLLTRSERGISLFDQEQGKQDFPAASKDVVDVTGAGDTVVSTVALMMAAGFSPEECCILANTAASIVCSKFGAATLSLNELMEQVVNSGEFKLVDVTTARYVLASLKEKGKKIVFTNGCFDMLHAGHLASFLQARKFGDVLIVAVNSDASVKRLKGPERPIVEQQNRIRMLCALECVDYVILMEDDTPVPLIQALHPDVTVKGKDWEDKDIPERAVVESYGGAVKFIDLEGGLSTTNLIGKIRHE